MALVRGQSLGEDRTHESVENEGILTCTRVTSLVQANKDSEEVPYLKVTR